MKKKENTENQYNHFFKNFDTVTCLLLLSFTHLCNLCILLFLYKQAVRRLRLCLIFLMAKCPVHTASPSLLKLKKKIISLLAVVAHCINNLRI